MTPTQIAEAQKLAGSGSRKGRERRLLSKQNLFQLSVTVPYIYLL